MNGTVIIPVSALVHDRRVDAQVRADLTAMATSYVDATGAAMRELRVAIDVSHAQMQELYEVYRAYLARCAQGTRLLARHRQRRNR